MSATLGWVKANSDAARLKEARSWRGRLKRLAKGMVTLAMLAVAIVAVTLLVRVVWNWGANL